MRRIVCGFAIGMFFAAGTSRAGDAIRSQYTGIGTASARETFGTKDHATLDIAAGSFTVGRNTETFAMFMGGRYGAGGITVFHAGASVPAGAVITGFAVLGCIDSPFGSIRVILSAYRNLGVAQPLPLGDLLATAGSGCGVYGGPTNLATPFAPEPWDTVHIQLLTNNETTPERNDARFYAVRIYYKLRVSEAPAVATFSDVPTTHPFFQFIEALAASGITAGCSASPPQFCPDAPLTRGQMAVFLSRALGLHWVY